MRSGGCRMQRHRGSDGRIFFSTGGIFRKWCCGGTQPAVAKPAGRGGALRPCAAGPALELGNDAPGGPAKSREDESIMETALQ
ncbi:hypothetical protein NDU88_004625 [Pleurodeles waltl]|uniref:Uncharacterized protein n=1 Tax=Pleurodeles waltl TaxID=8319 RepID=A0AAV7WX57_PLEWA|nr:hypothetical protein NDU88_004625 [Pleurodeles waltl]